MSWEEVALRRRGSNTPRTPGRFSRFAGGARETEQDRDREKEKEKVGGDWKTEPNNRNPSQDSSLWNQQHRDDVELIASRNGLSFLFFFFVLHCFPEARWLGLDSVMVVSHLKMP